MKDRELLELAAKLYGAKPHIVHTGEYYDDLTPDRLFWNPLRDDGDALRLAVKLGLEVYEGSDEAGVMTGAVYFVSSSARPKVAMEYHSDHTDPYTAARRAITRAAAQMQLDKETHERLFR